MAMLTFQQAQQRHRMVRDAVNGLHQQRKEGLVKDSEGAWNAVLGIPGDNSIVARACRTTIPLDYVPLMRAADGIPAAYFVVQLGRHLATSNADLKDDFVVRQVVRKAFADFEQRRKEANNVESGFGFDRSDAWKTLIDYEDQSERAREMMLEISKLAGRMFEAFRYYSVPQPTDDPQEVVGVEQGGDTERILDEEAAAFGVDPEVKVRVSEDKAYQYKMRGEAPRSRGPMVVALDESGSMGHHRLVWSKACAVALGRIARLERRPVRVVHYSTVTYVHDLTDDPRTMLELAKSKLHGGTCIDTAMGVAVDEVGDLEQNGFKGADIVFITDGEDHYSNGHFERMLEKDTELWTVAIDVDLEGRAKRAAERKQGNMRDDGYGSHHLYNYARAYIHINQAALTGEGGIKAATKLREAAMDNHRRDQTDAARTDAA
jgi:Mg-chelatase subunit ChlD